MSEQVTNKSILVVEDNIANQKVVMLQLRTLGFRAKAVSNGREAVQELMHSDSLYGLILMDCHMPVMDGYAATQHIRQLEQTYFRGLPIVAMTATAMDGDRELCLAAGMSDYMRKPVSLDMLRDMLNKWIPQTSVA
jgi:CheY-like chemotaxis protein